LTRSSRPFRDGLLALTTMTRFAGARPARARRRKQHLSVVSLASSLVGWQVMSSAGQLLLGHASHRHKQRTSHYHQAHSGSSRDQARHEGSVLSRQRRARFFPDGRQKAAATKPLRASARHSDVSSQQRRDHGPHAGRGKVILVDTNVLLDIATNDPIWVNWSMDNLDAAADTGFVAINGVSYSEFPVGYERIEDVDRLLAEVEIGWAEIPRDALFLAGKVFQTYRRQGGGRTSVLPDFFIGAHAAVSCAALLTRDVARYRTYFPTVHLIAPV
jgi:predicted nucleic acid-binding protein